MCTCRKFRAERWGIYKCSRHACRCIQLGCRQQRAVGNCTWRAPRKARTCFSDVCAQPRWLRKCVVTGVCSCNGVPGHGDALRVPHRCCTKSGSLACFHQAHIVGANYSRHRSRGVGESCCCVAVVDLVVRRDASDRQ